MSPWKFIATAVLALGLAAAPRLGAQTQAPSQPSQGPQASAGQSGAPTAPQAAPPAKPADVASPDAILAAVYEVISGPAGQQRDWDRFRSLYLPGARLIPTGPKKEGSGFFARTYTPDEYVARATPYFGKEGFYEKEAARRTECYGNITQVFSTYESRHDPKEPPFARGINKLSVIFRWRALVDRHRLLASRDAGESNSERISTASKMMKRLPNSPRTDREPLNTKRGA